MKHLPVTSSTIQSVGYNPGNRTLQVAFKGSNGKPGSLYEYANVPESAYAALMAAPSKGVYHAQHIKGKFDYEKVS